MRRYRLYIRADDKVIEELDFPATDDVVAEKLVEGWRNRRAGELWCGDRQVRRWRLGAMAGAVLAD
jgi:hypothetical protein